MGSYRIRGSRKVSTSKRGAALSSAVDWDEKEEMWSSTKLSGSSCESSANDSTIEAMRDMEKFLAEDESPTAVSVSESASTSSTTTNPPQKDRAARHTRDLLRWKRRITAPFMIFDRELKQIKMNPFFQRWCTKEVAVLKAACAQAVLDHANGPTPADRLRHCLTLLMERVNRSDVTCDDSAFSAKSMAYVGEVLSCPSIKEFLDTVQPPAESSSLTPMEVWAREVCGAAGAVQSAYARLPGGWGSSETLDVLGSAEEDMVDAFQRFQKLCCPSPPPRSACVAAEPPRTLLADEKHRVLVCEPLHRGLKEGVASSSASAAEEAAFVVIARRSLASPWGLSVYSSAEGARTPPEFSLEVDCSSFDTTEPETILTRRSHGNALRLLACNGVRMEQLDAVKGVEVLQSKLSTCTVLALEVERRAAFSSDTVAEREEHLGAKAQGESRMVLNEEPDPPLPFEDRASSDTTLFDHHGDPAPLDCEGTEFDTDGGEEFPGLGTSAAEALAIHRHANPKSSDIPIENTAPPSLTLSSDASEGAHLAGVDSDGSSAPSSSSLPSSLVDAPPIRFENQVTLAGLKGNQLEFQRETCETPWKIKVAFLDEEVYITKLPPLPAFNKVTIQEHPVWQALRADSEGNVRWAVEAINGKALTGSPKSAQLRVLEQIKHKINVSFLLRGLRK